MVLGCCTEQYILSNLILPSDVAKHLCVAQDLAKINVEHVSRFPNHDVVVVTVTDPQDEGGHAVAGTGEGEVLHSLWAQNPRTCMEVCDWLMSTISLIQG